MNIILNFVYFALQTLFNFANYFIKTSKTLPGILRFYFLSLIDIQHKLVQNTGMKMENGIGCR